MTIVMLVARHVVKEGVRERVLWSIAAVAALIVCGAMLVGQLTAGQDVRIIKDLGLAAIELAGVVMAVFVGVQVVTREIERRSIVNVLAKPLHRWQFVVGKFAGLAITVAMTTAGMSVAFLAVLAWMQLSGAYPAGAGVPPLDVHLAQPLLLIVIELWVLTAVAVLMSTVASNSLTAVLLTIGVWIVGLLSADLRTFEGASTVVEAAVRAVGAIVPAFSEFDVKAAVVNGRPVPWSDVGLTAAYGITYAAALVGAAVAVFSRRELE